MSVARAAAARRGGQPCSNLYSLPPPPQNVTSQVFVCGPMKEEAGSSKAPGSVDALCFASAHVSVSDMHVSDPYSFHSAARHYGCCASYPFTGAPP